MTIKRALLLFWAIYLTLVFTTNVLDAAKALGLLPQAWKFASGNYAFLVATTSRYGAQTEVNAVLFAGVVGWEGLAAFFFWMAMIYFEQRTYIYPAFGVGLGLWAAFVIADEVCIAYPVSATHWRLFTATLVTLLAVELLPDKKVLTDKVEDRE